MAEDVKGDEAEKVVDSKESFTKEIVEQMVADAVKGAVEETSKTLNANFQKQFAEIKKEKEEVVTSKATYEEETRAMVKKMTADGKKDKLLAKGIKAYSLAGLPVPDDEVILDMIREDSDDPLRVLNWAIANVTEAKEAAGIKKADEIAKKSGRKIVDVTPGKYDGLTYEEMAGLPNDEFKNIPQAIVEKVSKAAFG